MSQVSIAFAVLLFIGVLASRRPVTGLCLLLASFAFALPVATTARTLNSAIYVSDVVFLAFLIRWGPHAMRNARYGRPTGSVTLVILGILVAISRVQILFSQFSELRLSQAVFYTLRFVFFALPFLMVQLLGLDQKDFRKFATWLCLLAIGMAAGNLLTRLRIVDLSFTSMSVLAEQGGFGIRQTREEVINTCLLGFDRASMGIFAYLGLLFLFLRGWLGGKGIKIMLLVGLPLVAVMLLDSYSRAAMAGTVVAGVVLLMFLQMRHKASLIALAAAGVTGVLWLVTDTSAWANRFAALFSQQAFERSTGGERVYEWLRWLDFLGANTGYLLLGIGFLNFGTYRIIGAIGLSAAHNMYLHVLGELGMFGLAAFLALWGQILVTLYRQSRLQTLGPAQMLIGRTVFAAYVGLLASGLSQETLYPNPSVCVAASLCMLILGTTIGTLRTVPSRAAGYVAPSAINRHPYGTRWPAHARSRS